MTGRSFRIAVFLVAAMSGAAAQPVNRSVESVTVTAPREVPRAVIQDFITAHAAPTRMLGRIARWEEGACPITVGLKPQFTRFVTERVKTIAARVGALVGGASCTPNIEIVFTTAPQALLDDVRKNHPVFLGFHNASISDEEIAKVTRPIQAWYTTATIDLTGEPQVDSRLSGGITMAGAVFPFAKAFKATGLRTHDGLHSGFYHIIIAADPNKLGAYEMGSLADYIAMLALSEPGPQRGCQQLSSILDLLSPGCGAGTLAITDNDIAYLYGLYRMTADAVLGLQRDEVGYQMRTVLRGH